MPVSRDEKDYLWDHFKVNADQRLKAFNFFVVLSVFADGGLLAAFERQVEGLIVFVIAAFVVLSAILFAMIDRRSRYLTNLAVAGLREYEKQFPEHSRLFAVDAGRDRQWISYTFAFAVLYAAQFALGFISLVLAVIELR